MPIVKVIMQIHSLLDLRVAKILDESSSVLIPIQPGTNPLGKDHRATHSLLKSITITYLQQEILKAMFVFGMISWVKILSVQSQSYNLKLEFRRVISTVQKSAKMWTPAKIIDRKQRQMETYGFQWSRSATSVFNFFKLDLRDKMTSLKLERFLINIARYS